MIKTTWCRVINKKQPYTSITRYFNEKKIANLLMQSSLLLVILL